MISSVEGFRFLSICWALFLFGCATYQGKVGDARLALTNGQVTEAIEKLKPLAEQPGDDQLLYLMDYAMALQISGNFSESSKAFIQADKLSDMQDYHSISNVALATLGSEEMIQYKGESYEKLLINSFNSINFLMKGKYDEALVETRRVNDKIKKFRTEGREDYEMSPFAHYLGGLIWEAEGKYDDAYISFEKAYKLDSGIPALPNDLVRTARLARRQETYEKWKKTFPEVTESPDWYDRSKGDVIVIFQQGWGPRKDFDPGNRRMPMLDPVFSFTRSAQVSVNGSLGPKSLLVYNVERAAINTLRADYSWMVARKVGAFAAKEIVADQIRQKNEALGLIAWVAMHASDRADLRHWSTLPETVQVIRLKKSPGVYDLSVQGLDAGETPTSEKWDFPGVQVRPGRTVFINVRSLK